MNIGLIGFGNMGRAHAWSVENLKYYYGVLPFYSKIYAKAGGGFGYYLR